MNQNFSQQSLIESGTLNEKDLTLLNQCRGNHNKLGFAYQLIFIRLLNTLPDQSLLKIIEEIVVYAAIQLSINSTDIQRYKDSRRKIYNHQQKIIQYLNIKEFDENTQCKLNSFILDKSMQFESVGLLQIKASEFLRNSQILSPVEATWKHLDPSH